MSSLAASAPLNRTFVHPPFDHPQSCLVLRSSLLFGVWISGSALGDTPSHSLCRILCYIFFIIFRGGCWNVATYRCNMKLLHGIWNQAYEGCWLVCIMIADIFHRHSIQDDVWFHDAGICSWARISWIWLCSWLIFHERHALP